MVASENLTPDIILSVRTHNRLTQEQFANLLGVTTNTVNRWEKGHVKPTGTAAMVLHALAAGIAANEADSEQSEQPPVPSPDKHPVCFKCGSEMVLAEQSSSERRWTCPSSGCGVQLAEPIGLTKPDTPADTRAPLGLEIPAFMLGAAGATAIPTVAFLATKAGAMFLPFIGHGFGAYGVYKLLHEAYSKMKDKKQ